MVSAQLQQLAQLTGMQQGLVAPANWNAVRTAVGTDVPTDYKELVDNYGAGVFNAYVDLLGPNESIILFNLIEQGLYWDEFFKEEWEDEPDLIPPPLQGRSFTVIGWATTEDGVQLLWIAEHGVPSAQWQTAFYSDEGEQWEFHQGTAVEILLAQTRGELASALVPPRPPDRPATFQPYR